MSVDYTLYVSQARSDLTDADLDAILEESRKYNGPKGITGLLLYVRRRDGRAGSFMQMLEGDRDVIEQTRKRIFDDPRHHTKIVLESGTKAERDFSDWTMAFKNVPEESLAAHPVFKDILSHDFVERCRKGEIDGACQFLVDFWTDAD